MNFQAKTTKGHGFFRKSKAYGLVCGIALGTLVFAGQAHADEVTIPTDTTAATELVASTQEALAEVEMPENLNTAIETAKQAGAVVVESEGVVYETKEEAQNDYNEQAKVIEQAAEEQARQNATYAEEASKYEEELAKQEEVVKQYEEEVKQYEQQVEQNKQAELVNKALEEEYAKKISGIVEIPSEEQEKVETKDEIESRLATTSNVKIKDKTVLADGVLLEKGESEGVDVQILTFDKAGDYELVLKTFDSQSLTPENLEAGINELGAVAIVNGGFWSYGSVDSSWTQREFSLGKTGYIASSGNNNFLFGDYNTSLASDVMEFQGLGGFNIGAFGLLIKDGTVDYAWKTKLTGSDASDTGRNLLIETNDGQIKIVQNYGHSSKGTGWSITDVYDFLESMDVSTIKNAFMLDGGGSTRMATKAIDGNEVEVAGAFVDNRTTTHYLALVKTGTVLNDQVVVVDKNKVAEGTSKSITPAQYFESKSKGENTVSGTNYKVAESVFVGNRKYSTEPIEEPQYLPIVKVEKPIEPDLPELVKPVKPDPVKVSYHLVKVKEKQPVTPIETPAEEVDKPADNGGALSTPISPVEEETPIAETPIVSAEPEQPSVPEVTQTEDKEVKAPSTETPATTPSDSGSTTTPTVPVDPTTPSTDQGKDNAGENVDPQPTPDNQGKDNAGEQVDPNTGNTTVPTTDGGTAQVTPDKTVPTNNPSISADTANHAGASQVGTTSQVTGQVVQNVTPQAPIVTSTGYKVVSTVDSQLVVENTDGSTSTIAPETIGAKVNEDKTISLTTAGGETKTLPKTGDENTLKLVVLGFIVIIAGLAGYYKDKLKQLFNKEKKSK